MITLSVNLKRDLGNGAEVPIDPATATSLINEPKLKKPKTTRKPRLRAPKLHVPESDEEEREMIEAKTKKPRSLVNEAHGPIDAADDPMGGDSSSIFEEPGGEAAPDPLAILMSEQDIDLKTDLTSPLIIALARAEVAAEEFNTPQLAKFCAKIKAMRVSLGRLGRREVVEASRGSMDDPSQEGLFARMMNQLR